MSNAAHTPCPFCGGTKFQQNTKAKGYFIKKAAERAGQDTSNHLIRCTKCGAKGPLKHSESEAIDAWNTRPGHDPSVVLELIKAATGLASDVQCLIECRSDCGEWGAECPLQDAHKPDGTIDRLQRLLDILSKLEGQS